jgi:hypothetical protein
VQSPEASLHCGEGTGNDGLGVILLVCEVDQNGELKWISKGWGTSGEQRARVTPSHRVVKGPSQTARVCRKVPNLETSHEVNSSFIGDTQLLEDSDHWPCKLSQQTNDSELLSSRGRVPFE